MQNMPYIPQNLNVQPMQAQTAAPVAMSQPAYAVQQPAAAINAQAPSPTLAYPQNYYVNQPPIYTPQGQAVQVAPQTENNTQGIPPSASGVNIMIFNPTAIPAGGQVTNANNYFMPATQGQPSTQGQLVTPPPQPAPQPPTNAAGPLNGGNSNANASANANLNAPKYKKEVIQLTDEYIMSLENYLNSQDSKIRLMAAKELLKRFEEDPSRRNDVALTNLLNKALQDPSNHVRMFAMSAINAGHAKGDDLTAQLLNNLVKSQDAYGLDAELAASAALARVGQHTEIETTTPPKQMYIAKNPRSAGSYA